MRIVCVLVQLWLKESKVFLVQKLPNLLPPSVWESLLRELCHCEANCHIQSVQHVKKKQQKKHPTFGHSTRGRVSNVQIAESETSEASFSLEVRCCLTLIPVQVNLKYFRVKDCYTIVQVHPLLNNISVQ